MSLLLLIIYMGQRSVMGSYRVMQHSKVRDVAGRHKPKNESNGKFETESDIDFAESKDHRDARDL